MEFKKETIIILILFVVTGLSFDLLKHVGSNVQSQKAPSLKWQAQIGIPVIDPGHSFFGPKQKMMAWHVAADHSVAKIKPAIPTKAKPAPAAKQVAKKKVKSKKKKNKVAQQTPPPQPAAFWRPPAQLANMQNANGVQAAGAANLLKRGGNANSPTANANPIAPATPAQSSEHRSFREWYQYLFPTPYAQRVQELIKSYKAHQTTPQVYFELLGEMLNDTNPAMRGLGEFALASQTDVASFLFAANEISSSKLSDVKTALTRVLTLYESPQNVGILLQVLNSSTQTQPDILALQHLQSFLNNMNKGIQASSGSRTPVSPEFLSQVGSTLNSLKTRSKDPALLSLANGILASIGQYA